MTTVFFPSCLQFASQNDPSGCAIAASERVGVIPSELSNLTTTLWGSILAL